MSEARLKPADIADILGRLALFKELDPIVISRIAAGTQHLRLRRGGTLFRSGDHCHGFYLVLAGQIKLAMQSERGGEKVIEILGPGHSFGEAVMFLDKDYFVGAEALIDSAVLHVPKDAILAELDRDPLLIRRFLASLSLRLRGLLVDIENLSLNSARQRIIGYLLDWAAGVDGKRDGQPGAKAGSNEVKLPFKKSLLASRLNVTQEHFSRILHQLVEEGLIEVRGSTIRLLHPDKLQLDWRMP